MGPGSTPREEEEGGERVVKEEGYEAEEEAYRAWGAGQIGEEEGGGEDGNMEVGPRDGGYSSSGREEEEEGLRAGDEGSIVLRDDGVPGKRRIKKIVRYGDEDSEDDAMSEGETVNSSRSTTPSRLFR